MSLLVYTSITHSRQCVTFICTRVNDIWAAQFVTINVDGPGFIIPCPVSEPDNCFALFYFVINACILHVIITLIRYFPIPKSRDLVCYNPGKLLRDFGIEKRSGIPGSRDCNPYLPSILPAGEEKAGVVHSVSGWTRGVQVKPFLRTRAIPERLRDVFTTTSTRRYTNPRLPYPALPYLTYGGIAYRLIPSNSGPEFVDGVHELAQQKRW